MAGKPFSSSLLNLSFSLAAIPLEKLLYTPLEKLFILQSSEKSSPPHPLVSPGNALYALDKAHPGYLMQALT
ncbi:hypothetical protein V6N13_087012 [Hibiscus sabdariffa]|uniref:Uncharacterized protein n=1 Tax=Hibiscus sabdariffa TaxID=183260 RepID=A0ABR2FV26_9ROSI